MLKRIILGVVTVAVTSVFGMTLSQLNSATKAELTEIKGIGEVKAAAIIKERKKETFTSFEDLQRVKGIGKVIADHIKNDVRSGSKGKH